MIKHPTKPIIVEDGDSLGMYLKDIAKESLISNEKEIELSKRIKAGDESAYEELVKANLRFVISVAKQFQNRGVPLEDLIAEGNIGLLHAARLYDGERGIHFISYAVWWIRQRITKAIYYHGSDVRLPTSQIEPKTKILKVSSEFERKVGREPTIDELVELTGFTEEFIKKVQLSTNKCISLETPSVSDDENCTLGDCIPDDVNPTPDTITDNNVLTEEIMKILNTLNNREHDILCMVFGLNGCNEMSYEEIARKFALSSERVRQITNNLLKAFRTKKKYSDKFRKLYNG